MDNKDSLELDFGPLKINLTKIENDCFLFDAEYKGPNIQVGFPSEASKDLWLDKCDLLEWTSLIIALKEAAVLNSYDPDLWIPGGCRETEDWYDSTYSFCIKTIKQSDSLVLIDFVFHLSEDSVQVFHQITTKQLEKIIQQLENFFK